MGLRWKYVPLPPFFAAELKALHRKHSATSPVLSEVIAHARACGWTLDAMGEVLGVTRERVRQLAPVPKLASPLPLCIDVPVAPQRLVKVRGKVSAVKPCGTLAAYRRHLGKKEKPCELCKQANAAYHRDGRISRRQRDAPVHGRLSTYSNWGCRCDSCIKVNSAEMNRKFQGRPRGRDDAG